MLALGPSRPLCPSCPLFSAPGLPAALRADWPEVAFRQGEPERSQLPPHQAPMLWNQEPDPPISFSLWSRSEGHQGGQGTRDQREPALGNVAAARHRWTPLPSPFSLGALSTMLWHAHIRVCVCACVRVPVCAGVCDSSSELQAQQSFRSQPSSPCPCGSWREGTCPVSGQPTQGSLPAGTPVHLEEGLAVLFEVNLQGRQGEWKAALQKPLCVGDARV